MGLLDRMMNRGRRRELGAERVGAPLWELRAAIGQACETPPFDAVREDALEYYFERFLGSWLPEAIDHSLSTRELAQLDPDHVKQSAFLLLAQCVRKLREHLVPDGFPQKDSGLWGERFLIKVSELADLDARAYAEWVMNLEDLDDDAIDQVVALGKKLGVSGNALFAYHAVMIDVVLEDVFGIKEEDEAADEPVT
jgi:hypothetical protein